MASIRGAMALTSLLLALFTAANAAQEAPKLRRLLEIRVPERPPMRQIPLTTTSTDFLVEPGPRPGFKSSQRSKKESLPAANLGTSTVKPEPTAENDTANTFAADVALSIPKRWLKALKVIFSDPRKNETLPEDRIREERGDDDNLNRGFVTITQKEAYLVPEWTSVAAEAATWIDVLHLPQKLGNMKPVGASQGNYIYVSTKTDLTEAEKVTRVTLCRLSKAKLRWSRECCEGMRDGGRGNVWQTKDMNSVRGGDSLHICFAVEPSGSVLSAKLPVGEIADE